MNTMSDILETAKNVDVCDGIQDGRADFTRNVSRRVRVVGTVVEPRWELTDGRLEVLLRLGVADAISPDHSDCSPCSTGLADALLPLARAGMINLSEECLFAIESAVSDLSQFVQDCVGEAVNETEEAARSEGYLEGVSDALRVARSVVENLDESDVY